MFATSPARVEPAVVEEEPFIQQQIVQIDAIDPDFIPTYATPGSACVDLRSAETLAMQPGETRLISCGFKMALPPGWEMQIRSRSGLSLHGVTVMNAPGTIDSDYRGDVKVILHNGSGDVWTVTEGDRIAQACIQRTVRICFAPCRIQEGDTERGAGGFGSTGAD